MSGVNSARFLIRSGIVTWVLLIAIWWVFSLFYSSTFLPSPLETLIGAREIILDGTLFKFAGVSLWRVIKGWLIGCAVAVPIGILIGRNRIVRQLVEPVIDYFRFIPAIAFLTLFIMWFGVGEKSKTILIMYATCFTVIINTASGVLSIDENRILAARTLGTSEAQILFHVILPSCVPFIFTGVRLGMGGAYTSIVAAEMIAAKEGLGYLIFTSRLYFRIDWILAGVIVLGLIGFLTDQGLRLLGKGILKRYGINDTKEFDQGRTG
ncbi:ABC transporter permease [Leadbettera azotonutricia]|uniref:Taurine ABC transporter, permease protein n=1 Tax=Leadbettera azotonutricia (strain ATCC BAA-888 / DSM 13862 / ZAS-9) TaxID=545695 RepID=F5YCN1_LEAAZ|nr:ABC transporter permease [Leadbettera azotonutricia]AEF83410.1 taurine ABC transporter, permease protein [Leadbettera azotonutricia ZAS-9]